MEILFEIVIVRFIIRFLGVRTRHLFFYLIGKSVSKKELKGNEENGSFFRNDFLNALIGFLVLGVLCFCVIYLINHLGW